MARKKKNDVDMLGGDRTAERDLLAVNKGAPAEMLYESRGKKKKFLIWSFFIVALLSSALALNTLMNPPVQKLVAADVSSLDVNDSLGKSVAWDQVTSWLSTDPSPIPGGYIVSWDGFDPIAAGKPKNEQDKPADAAELHYFTLASANRDGTLFYDVQVLVSVDKARGAIAAAAPSLMARVPATSSGWSTQMWAGYESVGANDAVAEAINAWALAYTTSPSALRLYVADEDPSHSYMPLEGARVISANPLGAGYMMVDNQREQNPATVLARVEMTIAWTPATGGVDDNKGSRVQYDVLVEGANTASPRIVAWGAPGTGPKLKRFSNAVGGVTDGQVPTVPGETTAPDEETGVVSEEPFEETGVSEEPFETPAPVDETPAP